MNRVACALSEDSDQRPRLSAYRDASSLSTYDFSTLYTTLPYKLIKDKPVDFIERIFQREGSLYVACAFSNSDAVRNYNLWSCQTR